MQGATQRPCTTTQLTRWKPTHTTHGHSLAQPKPRLTGMHRMARGQQIASGGAAREDGDGRVQPQRLLDDRRQVGQPVEVVVRGGAPACA